MKAMNAMKGMKICYKDRDSEKAWTANVKVNLWLVGSTDGRLVSRSDG